MTRRVEGERGGEIAREDGATGAMGGIVVGWRGRERGGRIAGEDVEEEIAGEFTLTRA